MSLLTLETALGSIGRTAASAPVALGKITLSGVEVPSVLRVGGRQALVVIDLPGGDRIIQAMGANPENLTLAGQFIGPTALSRAQAVAGMRDAGGLVPFSVANLRFQVVIASFSYDLQQKNAVIPYLLEVVVQPVRASAASDTSAAGLASEIGSDAASALTAAANGAAAVATYAENTIGAAQNIVGQAQPVANLVGAGSLFAAAQDKLTAASALAQSGTNLAAAPDAAASLATELSGAVSTLSTIAATTGENIEGIVAAAGDGNLVADMGSLLALQANMAAHVGAVQAGQTAGRAMVNAQLAGGITPTPGAFHS